jgi:hypothetical protein
MCLPGVVLVGSWLPVLHRSGNARRQSGRRWEVAESGGRYLAIEPRSVSWVMRPTCAHSSAKRPDQKWHTGEREAEPEPARVRSDHHETEQVDEHTLRDLEAVVHGIVLSEPAGRCGVMAGQHPECARLSGQVGTGRSNPPELKRRVTVVQHSRSEQLLRFERWERRIRRSFDGKRQLVAQRRAVAAAVGGRVGLLGADAA